MSVRRVCIQTDRGGDPVSVDVALPAGAPVGELLPAIVDMVDGRVTPDVTAHGWRLDRLAGGIVDESRSLADNDIHDGDVIVLDRRGSPGLGPVRTEPCHAAAEARPPRADRALPGAPGVFVSVLVSVTLASTAGSATATTNVIIAAAATCAAAVAARASGYPTSSNLAVVGLAAATGFLAVPSAPAAPNVFLAAMSAFATALSTSRLSGRASATLIGVAALSLLTALVTVVSMPIVVVGAALSTASLTLLALAPRLSVLAARLGPDHWHDDVADHARVGHATLGGLVAGAAAGSAAGAALVAAAGATNTLRPIAFAGLIGAVLLLRARTYADPPRQMALVTAGLACAAACLWTIRTACPEYLGPVGGVLVVIGLVVARGPRIGASLARLLDALEYAAQAAVVPVACWIGGLYAHVGGLHLP